MFKMRATPGMVINTRQTLQTKFFLKNKNNHQKMIRHQEKSENEDIEM